MMLDPNRKAKTRTYTLTGLPVFAFFLFVIFIGVIVGMLITNSFKATTATSAQSTQSASTDVATWQDMGGGLEYRRINASIVCFHDHFSGAISCMNG